MVSRGCGLAFLRHIIDSVTQPFGTPSYSTHLNLSACSLVFQVNQGVWVGF